MLIDTEVHVYYRMNPIEANPEASLVQPWTWHEMGGDLLVAEMDRAKVDKAFLERLARMKNVTPCGEAGEYHTLVVNGPIFKNRLEIQETGLLSRDGHHILEIVQANLGGD